MGSSPLPVSLQSKLQKSSNISRLKTYSSKLNILRNIIFALFIIRITRKSFYFLRGYGPLGSCLIFYSTLRKNAYKIFLKAPGVRSQVEKQVASAEKDIEKRIAPYDANSNRYLRLPKEPWTSEQLHSELETLSAIKRTRWEEGKVSGAVYHGGDQLLDIQSEAMRLFSVSNPIHADVFPAVRKMEAEVVAMVLSMFNAPAGAAGSTTSGGTESILMACLGARNKGSSERKITEPEMIIPSTAHAAFYKAATYFKIKLRTVECPAPEYKVNISRVRKLINPNTILLVGSAPNYPHGIVDDIPALSRLATLYKIPLHVDCCLGSFLMPHLAKAGFESPYSESGGFDFRQPGVTSISVDTHKYGFAPKGSSVILYRSKKLRQHQYFLCPDWSGGVYGSPTMAGSRPGSLIAGAWASMMSVGEKGYIDATHKILTTRMTIENAIKEHPILNQNIQVLGHPMVSVVAFEAKPSPASIDVYDISDGMSKRGFHLNSLQSPPGVHIAVTLPMTKPGIVDTIIEELVNVVKEEREKIDLDLTVGDANGDVGLTKKKKGNTAQLYGVAGSLPDKSIVERILIKYLDTLYKAD